MKQVWECDYCHAHKTGKVEMRKHEKECHGNPAMRTCRTCRHFSTDYERSELIYRCAQENPRKRMKWQTRCPKWEAK